MTRAWLGIEGRRIHSELVERLGGQAPSIRTVYRWIERLKLTGNCTDDKHRVGRPRTATSQANITRVHELIKQSPRISIDYIQELTSLCRGTVVNIIQNHLKMRKLSSRWIPHELTPEQRLKRLNFCTENLKLFDEGKVRLYDVVTGDESWIFHRKIHKKQMNMEWVAEGDIPGTVVKRSQFEKKSMICVFFKSSGPLMVNVLEKGKTIDNRYYIENCLKPLFRTLESQRPVTGFKGIRLLHDNARPHIHANVHNFLQEKGIKLIDHPPYSPDLAPSDFWLFDEIKLVYPIKLHMRI